MTLRTLGCQMFVAEKSGIAQMAEFWRRKTIMAAIAFIPQSREMIGKPVAFGNVAMAFEANNSFYRTEPGRMAFGTSLILMIFQAELRPRMVKADNLPTFYLMAILTAVAIEGLMFFPMATLAGG